MRHIFRRVVHFFSTRTTKKEDSQQQLSSSCQALQTSIEPELVASYCHHQRQLRQIWQESLYLCVTCSIADVGVLGKKKRDSIVLSPFRMLSGSGLFLVSLTIGLLRIICIEISGINIQCIYQLTNSPDTWNAAIPLDIHNSLVRNFCLSSQIVLGPITSQSPIFQTGSHRFLPCYLHVTFYILLHNVIQVKQDYSKGVARFDKGVIYVYTLWRRQKNNVGDVQRLNIIKVIEVAYLDWTPGFATSYPLMSFIIVARLCQKCQDCKDACYTDMSTRKQVCS